MPRGTFHNLPPGKRALIIEAALREFGSVPFSKAKVANIVKEAGIPRGSFYQYFDDLMDLYRYLWDLAVQRKLEYMQQHGHRLVVSGDVFQRLRSLYRVGLQFVIDNPEWARLGVQFYREDHDFRIHFDGELERQGLAFYRTLLQEAQAVGEVRSTVSVTIAATALYQMNRLLVEEYLNDVGVPRWQDDMDKFLQRADAMIDLLENGLRGATNHV